MRARRRSDRADADRVRAAALPDAEPAPRADQARRSSTTCGTTTSAATRNVVETYISYLRKKLDPPGPPLIHTVRGVGYALRRRPRLRRPCRCGPALMLVRPRRWRRSGSSLAGCATYAALRSFLVDRVDRSSPRRSCRSWRARRARRRPGALDARRRGRAAAIAPSASARAPSRRSGDASGAVGTRRPRAARTVDAARHDRARAARPSTLAAAPASTACSSRDATAREPAALPGARAARRRRWSSRVPLDEVDDTLHQLLLVELASAPSIARRARRARASGSCASACGRSERIEHTADAIAGGDLSQRVENDDPRTEVGRLGRRAQRDARPDRAGVRRAHASRSSGCAASSPTRRTSCARRSPSMRGYAELFRRGAAQRPDDLETRDAAHRGRVRADGRARRRPAPARPARRGPRRSSAGRSTCAAVARDAVEATPARSSPTARSSSSRRGPGRGGGRPRAAAPGARQPAAQRARPHAGGDAGRRCACCARAARRVARGARPGPGPAARARRAPLRALLPRGRLRGRARAAARARAWRSSPRSSRRTAAARGASGRPGGASPSRRPAAHTRAPGGYHARLRSLADPLGMSTSAAPAPLRLGRRSRGTTRHGTVARPAVRSRCPTRPAARSSTSSSPSTTRRPTSSRACAACTRYLDARVPVRRAGSRSPTTRAPTRTPADRRAASPTSSPASRSLRLDAEGPRPRAAGRVGGERRRRCSPTWTSTCRPTSPRCCRWSRR